LQNYNKGIQLSRGEYIWLISADDRLRRPYVLERYVRLMDDRGKVGYVFCAGIGLRDGTETEVLDSYYYGAHDKIFAGRQFIAAVLHKRGGILAASVMARKDCYQKISMYPLDMPHQGDMYLWFLYALEHDVAYLSEPMVNYRAHDLNMMSDLLSRAPKTVFTDEVNVLWRIKRKAEQKQITALSRHLEYSIASKYEAAAAFAIYGDKWPWAMSVSQCEQELHANAATLSEYKRLRGSFYGLMADRHWRHRAFRDARGSYFIALRENWRMPKIWLKVFLSCMGTPGGILRNALVRNRWQRNRSDVSAAAYSKRSITQATE
jgi:glycosyltransferase involved in cell wall biosynthesis